MNPQLPVDTELSTRIPEWRAIGEGQTLEFKQEIPEQTTNLAKDIAAIASSGGGIILLGVNDEGDVVGLDIKSTKDHDRLDLRVSGIIDSVSPKVKLSKTLATDEGAYILVMDINYNQDEPVFYVNHRPYVRDGRRSRPAEPHEVKELVWKHPSSEAKREHERAMQRIADNVQRTSDERARQWDEITRKMFM